jgi:arsenate reductase (thioredoxin)
MENAFKVLAAGFLVAGLALGTASAHDAARPSPKAAKPTHVLFMCPHGAAKSVLAAAYFTRLAKERGLDVRVDSAGTEPDAAVAPAVATHLKKNGYEIPIAKPRQATADDVATHDVVVSMGCDLKGLPKPKGTLLNWDDVPGPGEDFARADDAIKKRVTALVEELVRQERSPSR